jgi:hypothetical protein
MHPTRQLINHVTMETAYLIERFPYATGKNSQARYWVETKQAYGQRGMFQYRCPVSGQWFKPKHAGYYDLVVMEALVDDGNPNNPQNWNAGHVVIHNLDLKQFSLEVILQLAQYYVFTPFQKQQIMEALATHHHYRAPAWKDSSVLDYNLTKRSETEPDALDRVVRATDSNGFTIESAEDAHKRALKEARANQPSRNVVPEVKKPAIDDDDTTGMSELEIARYNAAMGRD